MAIGHSIKRKIDMIERVKPVLRSLSKDIKETVQLGILHNYKIIYIDRIDSDNIIKINFDHLGYKFEVNWATVGLLLPAYLEMKNLKIYCYTQNL